MSLRPAYAVSRGSVRRRPSIIVRRHLRLVDMRTLPERPPRFGKLEHHQSSYNKTERDEANRTMPISGTDNPIGRPQTQSHAGATRQTPSHRLVGDTYIITVRGEDTNGRFCFLDMHIPPGGGPPPHRHDFEETFIPLEGEMEATFRCTKSFVARWRYIEHSR